jgi:hypothetical protein
MIINNKTLITCCSAHNMFNRNIKLGLTHWASCAKHHVIKSALVCGAAKVDAPCNAIE